MDMTVVLGIFTFFFFVTLSIMCFYRTKINVKLCNVIFIIADFLAYSAWNYAAYLRGWLDDGWMTLGNISPLMFTLILLTPFMNERVREYVHCAIACLSLGMFLAMLISPEHDYIFNFNTELTYQHSSNEEVLPLPDFNAYANIFLKFRIAKVLNTEIGVDAWYFTSYYAPDYLPALGQFVQQNQANKVKIL